MNKNPLLEDFKELYKHVSNNAEVGYLPLEEGSGLVRLGLVGGVDYSTQDGSYIERRYDKAKLIPELYTDASGQNLIILENPPKYYNEINNISKRELKRLYKLYIDFIQASPKEYVCIELDLKEPLILIGNLHKIIYSGTNGRVENEVFIHTHGEPNVPKLYTNKSGDLLLATEYIQCTERGIENTFQPYI
jgi:hypothetical protein